MPRAKPSTEKEEERSHSEPESEDSESEEVTFEQHLALSQAYKDTCREAFLAHTVRIEWKGKYLLHALCWGEETSDMSSSLLDAGPKKWPHVWAGDESQPVKAAMWDTRASGFKLVAAWTSSSDEFSLFFLDGDWKDDAVYLWECSRDCGGLENDGFPDDCEESFMVTSGDDTVDNLYCPALEGIGPKSARR